MLELAHGYGGDLLDFMKRHGKLPKKGFLVTRSLEERAWVLIGHPVHRDTKKFFKP
jgi:hypothetical protein